MSDFKTITPMRYDEREEQMDPGTRQGDPAQGITGRQCRFGSTSSQITFARAGLSLAAGRCPALLPAAVDLASRAAPRWTSVAGAPAGRCRSRERYAALGDLPFWLCLILSIGFLILALARPHGPATAVRAGRHRRGHPAGRLGLDARQGRGGRSLAAIGPVPAHARRFAQLE